MGATGSVSAAAAGAAGSAGVPSPAAEAAPIYLDYNATTPVLREVADEMEPFLRLHFGYVVRNQ